MTDKKVFAKLEFDKILKQLMQKAMSEGGRRLAEELAPTEDRALAERWMQETMEAETISLSSEAFPMQSYPAIGAELARLNAGAALSCGELLRVKQLLQAARRAKKNIRPDEERDIHLLPEIASGLVYDDYLIEVINQSIESEDEVADSASSELRAIRRRMVKENDAIREKLNSVIRGKDTAKYLQESIITMRNGRYVVPVKVEYRSQINGLIHGESASGATLFIEPMSVVEANNRLKSLEEEERREIERILAMLSDLARPSTEDMKYDYEILSYLDLVFAKAALGIGMKAHPVAFNDSDTIDIRMGRHPLIDAGKVIPISVKAEEPQHTLIITGPNTGGKTVTLKMVGLFALMAQSGLFLPAESGTSMPVFQAVYADIGDEQSIEQSLSTFSSHMKNNIFILRKAQQGSLVLLDELGAGTDPEEGTALALAILDELNARGVKLLATTHYSEIKAYALTAEGFVNASMEFDAESLKPTYRLIMGVAGASNAFLISKRLGLKNEIIEKARGFMREERLQFDSLLREAERTKSKAEKQLSRAREMESHAREMDARAKQQEEKLEQKRQKILDKAREEALQIVNEAREETEEIIQEVKRLKNQPEAARTKTVEKARKTLSAKREKLQKPKAPAKKGSLRPEDLAIGDGVRILSLNVDGSVLALPDDSGMVAVQAGIMKLNIPLSDLALAQQKKRVARTSSVSLETKPVSMSINLHGYTVEEAIVELDKYLDDAFLAGLQEVSIIHGKGTGALRSGVQSYLRHHPHVEKFRLGKYGEGETGVTIVSLK